MLTLNSDTVAVLAVLARYWGRNTRDFRGMGPSPAVLPRLWGWVFLTYMKIRRMCVVQSRMHDSTGFGMGMGGALWGWWDGADF